jgi:internalin A
MALEHDRPDETLNRELTAVSHDSNALLEYLRAPNALADTFPLSQLVELCQSLSDLPQGTAEGCREPLVIARERLPAIRREHIPSEDQIWPLADEDEMPPPFRGGALDRFILNLLGAVTTALYEYRSQATEPFDDAVVPEPVVDIPADSTVREAVARSRSVEAELRSADNEIREITVPGSSRADQLLRTIKDAEILNRVVRSELTMPSVALRWFRVAVDTLKDYPGLIRQSAGAIRLVVDVARPLVDRWHEFEANLSSFALDQLSKTAQAFDAVSHVLESRRRKTPPDPRPEEIDPRQIKAEREARELILSGTPVPPEIAKWVRHLNLSGDKYAPTRIPDFGLVAELSGITRLDIKFSNVGTLDFLLSLRGLSSLTVHANQASDLIPLSGLTGLTFLSVQADQASDITPLSGLTGLTSLFVQANRASDLTPLQGLTGLTSLSVQADQARDLTPLRGMTGLTSLSVQANRARDLTPLQGLTGLTSLSVYANQASDLTPLQRLTSLTSLSMHADQASDLTPLQGLTGLTSLTVQANQASDLTPLSGLTGLTSLSVQVHQVSDLSSLSGLTELASLSVNANRASDLTPLQGLTGLTSLSVQAHQVSDFSPLSGLTELTSLSMNANQAIDLTPLQGLTGLNSLNISGCAVTDLSPLGRLQNLAVLTAYNTKVTDWQPVAHVATVKK